MRLLLFLQVFILVSCLGNSTQEQNSTNTKSDTIKKVNLHIDSLLVDTAKTLKAGEDYLTIAPAPSDKIYFGNKFSPYKMEPYDIAHIEQIIDSLIKSQKVKPLFKNKILKDFKYQIFSVRTSQQKLQVRVVGICNEKADEKKWTSLRIKMEDSTDCYFSFTYDLTDKKIITFQINEEG